MKKRLRVFMGYRRLMAGITTFLVFSCLLQSCSEPAAFDKTKPIEEEYWDMKDTVNFTFTMEDTVNPYNFFIKVRNSSKYEYRNLYLFVNMQFPNGKNRLDTVECILADKKGRWLGSGLGDIIDNEVMFKYKRRFPLSGKYKVGMTHAMRDEKLEEILDVGFKVKKHKK